MSLFLAIVAIAIPALAFVLLPYMRRKDARSVTTEDSPLDALREEKARIYHAIKEIAFEHEADHLSDEDYRELRERYEIQAAGIVSQLDALGEARQPEGEAVSRKRKAPQAAERAEIHWSRRPLTLVFGSLILVAFGLALGVGIARYTAPDPSAMTGRMTTPPGMPLPSMEGPERSGGQRTLSPEMLRGMLAAAHQSLDEGRYQEAIAAYKAVLNRSPQNVEAITHLGIILALAGHLDNALEAFDKAIALDPTYAHAYWDKARILSEQKQDYRGAIQAWEKFVQHAPPGTDRDHALRMIQEAKGRLLNPQR